MLDRDLFPEPHRLGEAAGRVRKDILKLGNNCPWSLRRLKEDLKDMRGQRLFPDRHVQTVSFDLGPDEYTIYKAVTAYINEFLPQATGRRKNSVAFARTVFQRRLASSMHAIHESLRRRRRKLDDLLRELQELSPAQRARRLAQLQGRLSDAEQDEDDLDETDRDILVDEATTAAELNQLRTELAELGDLVTRVGRVRESGRDSKLVALRECLQRSEFDELKDGRGKLLLFTEHRDTLDYLRENLDSWGYSTCRIHGGMNPRERQLAQEDFRTSCQICVATEAAGEGINLQFCHLMINYDLPWNPTRLEQRLGRIHRIGQTRDVYAFNFVATSSEDGQPVIEGRILERLLMKLERMREALGDRVFDMVGEVLALNKVNLPDMLREVAYEPRRLDDYLDIIDRIDPDLLDRYEDATGIALARGHVDFTAFAQANLEAEERRLMPRYVESRFVSAAQDRVMRLRVREPNEPEVALARQRAEQDLADLDRARQERIAGIERLRVARHGPVHHVASCLVLPPEAAVDSFPELTEGQDAASKRRVELAAEDIVEAYENAHQRECERVGHLKIGFDIRSLAKPDPQTGYRDPVTGVRRIEVKGRKAGHPVRLTTNEWYKAQQLGDTYWLYVVWDPVENPDAVPVMVQNPGKHLDHAKKEVVAARHYDIPAAAVETAAQKQRETST